MSAPRPEWQTGTPGWEGADDAEFLMSDGTIVVGSFVDLDSVWTNDEDGSYPVWEKVRLVDGREMNPWDERIKGWRRTKPWLE